MREERRDDMSASPSPPSHLVLFLARTGADVVIAFERHRSYCITISILSRVPPREAHKHLLTWRGCRVCATAGPRRTAAFSCALAPVASTSLRHPPLTSGARPTFSVIRYLRCPLRNGRSLGTRRSSVFREARSDLKKERNGRDLSSGV